MAKQTVVHAAPAPAEDPRWKMPAPVTGQGNPGFLAFGAKSGVYTLIGTCIKLYQREFAHRRRSTAYHVAESINHFLTTTLLHERLPMCSITQDQLIMYKNALLEGTAPLRHKRAPRAATISKKLGLIKAWLEWSTNNGYLEKNPMRGLDLPRKLVTSQKIIKRSFTDSELSVILTAIAKERHDSRLIRQEFYWLTKCLMYSGARLAEINGIRCDEVHQIDGIWCFIIQKNTARDIKNTPSNRIIPVAGGLIAEGFLDWHHVQTSTQLFPLLLSKTFVKASHFFAYLLKKNNIKVPAISLHSFRHLVTVKLERNRIHPSVMHRLLGHSLGSGTEQTVYLRSLQYPPAELQSAIDSMSFVEAPPPPRLAV